MPKYISTWRKMIERTMTAAGESFSDVVAIMPPDLDLDREFDQGSHSNEGEPFTLWTANRVYFPVDYDGEESVASVPRNPCEESPRHIGG